MKIIAIYWIIDLLLIYLLSYFLNYNYIKKLFSIQKYPICKYRYLIFLIKNSQKFAEFKYNFIIKLVFDIKSDSENIL